MGIVLLVLSFLGGLLGDIATLIVLLAAVFGGSAWIYLYSYLVYGGEDEVRSLNAVPLSGEGGPAAG